MSIFFEAGETDLWNPSNNVGRLYVGQARLFETLLGTASGISDVTSDTVYVDKSVFSEFVGALTQLHEGSNHPVYRNLMRGFVATSLILARRANLPSPDPEDLRDLVSDLDKAMHN